MTALVHSLREAEASVALRALLAMSGAVLFYTSIDLYAYEAWATPSPAIWMMAFMGAAAVSGATQPERLAELARAPLMRWLVAFFLLTTAWAVFVKDVPSTRQALQERYRSMAFLAAFALLFQGREVRRATALALAGAVAAGAMLNIAEAVGLLKFAPHVDRVPGRSSALYANANYSGLSISAGVAAVVPRIARKWRMPLLVLSGIGVALTFSRSAALAFAIVAVVLAWTGAVRIGRMLLVVLTVAALVLFFAEGLTSYLETAGVLNENTWARLRLTLHDSGRIAVAKRAWELFAASPLFGNGVGATADWDVGLQTHNQYLFFAAEHGILGLLVLPALAVALAVRSRIALPFSAVLLVAGFFSHGLFVARATLLLIAFVGASSADAEQDDGEEPSV